MFVFHLSQQTTLSDSGPTATLLARSPAARYVLFAFKAGQQLKEHSTSSQISVQVISGELFFTVRESSRLLKRGDLLLLDGGIPHTVVAQEDAVMLLTLTPDPQMHTLSQEGIEALSL